jgi:cytochrome c oxidase subunit I+III
MTGSRAPLWWAMLLFVLIGVLVFATLLSSYLYLRFLTAQWPPAGAGLPGLLLPGVRAVLLLGGGAAILWAGAGIREDDAWRLQLGTLAALGLAGAFLALGILEVAGFEFAATTHAYGSVVWSILILHMACVAAAMLMAGSVFILAGQGYFTRERRLGVELMVILWIFVTAIKLPIFAVVYLLPRLSQ